MYLLFAILVIVMLIAKTVFRSVWFVEEVFLSVHALILLYEAYQKRKEWTKSIENVPSAIINDAKSSFTKNMTNWEAESFVDVGLNNTTTTVVIVKSSHCNACTKYMQSDSRIQLQHSLSKIGKVGMTILDIDNDNVILKRYGITNVHHVPCLFLVNNRTVISQYDGDVYAIPTIVHWVRQQQAN